MSLIITSSHEVGETPQYQVDAPYAFRNNFGSGMKIPANSEIAVESVKINRQPTLDYEPSQTTLFWFGQRLETNASFRESQSYIIPSENTIRENLSPQDFSESFVPMINTAYSVHPEINTVSGISMTPLQTASTSGFEGFRYNINQIGASATSKVPPTAALHVIFEGNAGQTDWDGTTLTAGGDDTYVQLQPEDNEGGPISLFDGVLTFNNFSTAGSKWRVGLSRPIINQATSGFLGLENPYIPCGDIVNGGLGQDQDQFYDYVAESDGSKVRLYHAVPMNETDSSSNLGEIEMREIIYYQDTDSATTADNAQNSSFAGGSPMDTASVVDITFTVQNEIVEISASGNTLARANVVTSASFKDQVPKPVSQTCWKMYPTIGLETDDDTVDVAVYKCRDNTTIKDNKIFNDWAVKCRIHANMDDFEERTQDADGAARITDPWNDAWDWVTDVEFRKLNIRFLDKYGVVNSVQDGHDYVRAYKGLNASTMEGYEQLFIVGKNDRYTSSIVQKWSPNSHNVLGFSPFSVVPLEESITETSGQASFTSTTRPNMSSESSTFIRVPTLNHKTFNFGTGNPSKILFQVPRFDNSGAETGALFFQNQDKSFIDLNNPVDTMLTDLDVQFVRKDEKFAKDLTGSSEVVFFVRPKAHKH